LKCFIFLVAFHGGFCWCKTLQECLDAIIIEELLEFL
jgi:hypothetical protein